MKELTMKNIFYNRLCILQLLCMVVIFTFITGCKDDDERVPVITDVRNYAPSPNDTVITSLNAGQWVVLQGKNLSAATQVYFADVPATFNRAFLTDETMVVQVPTIPFLSVPKDKLHIITVVSKGGATDYEIKVTGAPIIVDVRNTDGEIIDRVFPEQQINIVGINLENASSIKFQGIAADLSTVVYTDSSAIVQVPADLSGGDASLANMISYTTAIGSGTFSIKIIGPPIIVRVSNEVPNEGDQVYLYGNNLSFIESLTFAGVEISSFEESEDGSSVKFVAPALTQGGPVIVTTGAGTFTSAYNVNDINSGILSNYQWDADGGVFRWDWWGGASLGVEDASLNEGWITAYPEFKGNHTKFLAMSLPVQPSGGGADWNTAIRMTGSQARPWFPSNANLDDPAGAWALKFEINIPQNWDGGTLVIKTNNTDYIARYEPWQISDSKTAPYKTNGWQTVTIPLTSFRKNDGKLGDGKGAPITTVKDLFNAGTTTSNLLVYIHNYSASDTKTGFTAAFDNFRVVKQ